jgi:hypothetical protein
MSPRRRFVASLAAGAGCALALLYGCSSPPVDARFTELVPDRTSFPHVAQALERHCGELDCHGTPYRNMRIYGNEGLRWLATDRPLSPPCTTSAEVTQDFDSVVGLEPEIMASVVAGHGADPGQLTMIRKALGTEAHKGGVIMLAGDALDVCLTSWLASQTDVGACETTAPATLPSVVSTCEPGP